MASGYEKAECGVDPNYGWRGEPDSPAFRRKMRRQNIILTVLAIIYTAFFYFMILIVPILRGAGVGVFNGN